MVVFPLSESTRRRLQPIGCKRRARGETNFDMERVGAPSRWNTLRALRVLDWREKKASG
jgi:hypothetical protein